MNTFNDHIISWEAPEFIQHEKSWLWFAVAAFAAVGFAIWAVLTGNWTLVVAIVVVAALYIWLHGQTPNHLEVKVSKTGIRIGNKEIPYQNMHSFWILYNPPHIKTLNIKSNSRIYPDLSIDLDEQDPAELRTFLCAHVKEDEGKEENFADIFIRLLKL